MAFTQGVLRDVAGEGTPVGLSFYCRVGWFKSAGVTTGEIETGFPVCYFLFIQPHAAAVGNDPVVNEVVGDVTQPMSGSVTIITDVDEVGRWVAFGI